MKNLLKLVKSALIVIGLTGTANAADLSAILSAGVVKIAVPESFPPFGSVGASGEHEGYDVDVAKLIAKDLGVELELVPVVSKQRIPFLETDRVDLVISTMGANPPRQINQFFQCLCAVLFRCFCRIDAEYHVTGRSFRQDRWRHQRKP